MNEFSAAFEDALREVLRIEGEYSDHPADPGGKTRWGITEAVAREHGYEGPMTELPIGKAKAIYWTDTWVDLMLQDVHDLSPLVAKEMMDTAVNMGDDEPARAVYFLQRPLNVLNKQKTLYDEIEEDGWMGPETMGALRAYLKARPRHGEVVLVRMLNTLQGQEYIELTREHPSLESFVFGWFRQRIRLSTSG